MIRHLYLPVRLARVVVTAGHAGGKGEAGVRLVPKLDLAGVLQALFQSRRLDIVKGLPDAATLMRELLTFRTKVTTATGTLPIWPGWGRLARRWT
jgi:hypothetical protein